MTCDCFVVVGRVWSNYRAFTSGGQRVRDVELMCLDGLAWMMLALFGRRLGSLVLEDTRWSCDCFLLDGRAWSECRLSPNVGWEREREVELICLDGLACMMLALCCGRCLGLLVLEDAR
ncbi:hypothetical protein CSA_017403 [Cucumis sativus]|uniref:Uncharacterized protein n=1 Tax=Cucumis sativus TaxID=3659 RepID=A0ACB6HCB2_CUCSA|nr:hypothetical protein CSA_017403 [Cucumis sativus]